MASKHTFDFRKGSILILPGTQLKSPPAYQWQHQLLFPSTFLRVALRASADPEAPWVSTLRIFCKPSGHWPFTKNTVQLC